MTEEMVIGNIAEWEGGGLELLDTVNQIKVEGKNMNIISKTKSEIIWKSHIYCLVHSCQLNENIY